MPEAQKEPDIMECQLVMIAYRKTLRQLIGEYAPAEPEEPPSRRFLAAVKSYRRSREMLDMLLSPNHEDRLEGVATLCENDTLESIKQFIISKGGPRLWQKKEAM